MKTATLETLPALLQGCVANPTAWQHVLTTINEAVEGAGTVLLAMDDRLKMAPCSPDLAEMKDAYFQGGWPERDERYRGRHLMECHGVTTDPDFVSEEEMRRSEFYSSFLGGHGRKWFAGIGFTAGADMWCLSIQRSIAQGPFQNADIARLKALWRPFADTATLCRTVGRSWIQGTTRALDVVGHAAFVCDRRGSIIDLNGQAERLLPAELGADRSVHFADPVAADLYAEMLREALGTVVASTPRTAACTLGSSTGPLQMRAIRLDGEMRLIFDRAALLVLVKPQAVSPGVILRRRFGLTAAEERVALALASGADIRGIAQSLSIAPGTVRTHLKAAFGKTGARSQAQLVALIAGLRPAADA